VTLSFQPLSPDTFLMFNVMFYEIKRTNIILFSPQTTDYTIFT